MATRNVVLTEQQEAFLTQLVRSGRYRDAGEVLGEGLRLIERRESKDAAKLEYLRARLDLAERDIAEGRLVTYEPGLLDRLDEETDEDQDRAAAS